jgi:branched-subunit amino acid aminotransferase/4-amino-4-deoxychorismate lyase
MSKIYPYFSRNGQLLTIDKAVVPLDSVEYSYGFGVYETIRVTKSIPNFLDEHCARLMASAAAIGLEHLYESKIVQTAATDLLTANKVEACNLKILLVGGSGKETASLYILCLNPLFPDRKLYKSGVHTITKSVERPFPQAKTLNMLPSFLIEKVTSPKEHAPTFLSSKITLLFLRLATIFCLESLEIMCFKSLAKIS